MTKEEEYLEKQRSIYRSVRATPRLSLYGWKEISGKIDGGWQSKFSFLTKSWAAAILSVMLLVAGGFVFSRSVKAALPGEPLYGVKIFSENVVAGATGDNQIKIDNRAEEIVDLVEKKSEDEESLKKVSEEYSREVERNRERSRDSGEERERLRENLEEDHKEFDEAVRRFPEAEEDIKDAIEASQADEHSGGESSEEEKD